MRAHPGTLPLLVRTQKVCAHGRGVREQIGSLCAHAKRVRGMDFCPALCVAKYHTTPILRIGFGPLNVPEKPGDTFPAAPASLAAHSSRRPFPTVFLGHCVVQIRSGGSESSGI